MKTIIASAGFLLLSYGIFGQETAIKPSNVTLNLNADLVSRYLWRGLLFSPNVNLQPYAGLSYKGLTFSTWASYGISDHYAEVDFSLSYTLGNLTFSLNDYYAEIEDNLPAVKHFDWGSKTTSHSLEAALNYTVSESFPLGITAATFIYGNDRKANGDNYYSTYIELAWPLTVNEYSINLFAGGTIAEGLYADKAALVHTGISLSKEIKFTDAFSLPVSATLSSNPKAEDIFLVFKATF